MKKLTATIDGDMVLKYQVIPEELDALVTVRSDEDLKHMLYEHDRHESEGNPKLRAFLFPSNPIILENQVTSIEPRVLEQRYIDAINGIFRTTPHPKLTSINTNKSTFSISSGCSSPHSNSPDGQNVDAIMTHESNLSNVNQNGKISVHRVQSSPTLYCLNNFQNLSNNPGNHHLYQHHQHYHLNHQHHLHHGYHPRPMDSHRGDVGGEMLTRNWSLGRVDGGRSLMGRGLNPHYTSSCHHRESGGCINWGYHEEHSVLACTRLGRSGSLSRSPSSPRNAFLEGEKAWSSSRYSSNNYLTSHIYPLSCETPHIEWSLTRTFNNGIDDFFFFSFYA